MREKKGFIIGMLFFAFVAGVYVAYPLYLGALGRFLVISDSLIKVDAIVVLDGDYPRD